MAGYTTAVSWRYWRMYGLLHTCGMPHRAAVESQARYPSCRLEPKTICPAPSGIAGRVKLRVCEFHSESEGRKSAKKLRASYDVGMRSGMPPGLPCSPAAAASKARRFGHNIMSPTTDTLPTLLFHHALDTRPGRTSGGQNEPVVHRQSVSPCSSTEDIGVK